MYAVLADAVLVVHLGFIVFTVLGGFLLPRFPRLVWLHLPCALWGALVELGGWLCPLTPLENRLRLLAGERGYEGGFVERYLLPVIYPEALTREIQIALGLAVLAINAVAYARWHHARRRHG